jgi:hypothetical protein
LSVVVFGPGHGEAIVVVLPNGEVGVVDGCREPTVLDPVKEFLDELARQPERKGQPLRLAFVCMTHPHEDHYRGLWRLLEAYRGRVDHVWRTPDVGDRYVNMWLQLLKHTHRSPQLTPDPDDVEGLTRLVTEMRLACQKYGARLRQLQQGMELLKGEVQGAQLHISACGPCATDLETATITLLGTLKSLAGRQKPAHFDPNAVSGALVVRWGKAGVLLGGDLLCGERHFRGWDEVHADIEDPIQVIKAAHHASEWAHHEVLLSRLKPDLTIVTPFLQAKADQPPRPDRIAELAKSSVVAITAEPSWHSSAVGPQALYVPPKPPAATGVTSGGFPNNALTQAATAGEVDAHNAVAVSLDASGHIVGFVLAGKANVYEPPVLASKPVSRRAAP